MVKEDTRFFNEARHLYEEGRAFMDSGEFEKAVGSFGRSAILLPHFKTLELHGECLYRIGRLNEAVIPLAAATALNRGVRAPSLLAKVFLELGDVVNAKEISEEALSRDRNNKLARGVAEAIAKF